MQFIFLALLIYLNISVYREVCRNEKQIIANQVSTEVKERLLKNKKAFYCTIIVLFAVFLLFLGKYHYCYHTIFYERQHLS